MLTDPLNSYLELEDACVSRINAPGEIIAHYEEATIRKDNIVFIILARREDGDPPKSTGTFLRPVTRKAFITLPAFEVFGTIETDPNASPREILVQSVGRFVAIYDGAARAANYPKTEFNSRLILINRERIEALCLVDT